MAIYDETDFERALKHLKERDDVLPENKKTISDFLTFKKLTGRGAHRRLRYLQNLVTLSKLLGKPFKSSERADFERLLSAIREKGYSESTQLNFRIEIKCFQAWLRGCDRKQYPKEVSWIETGCDPKRNIDRDQLLNDDDVERLIRFAVSPRIKVAVALLFQTGVRPSELLDLKVKDFFLENGIYGLRVRGTKTAAAVRDIPVIDAKTIELVNAWLAIQAKNGKPEFKESNLWLSESEGTLEYFPFANTLRNLFKTAEIKKPTISYLFRHSRATIWANDPRITRSQLCYLMGWTQSSRVVDTYLHTNQKDLFNTFAKIESSSPDKADEELTSLGKQMLEVSLKKDQKLNEIILSSWKKNSPDLFARFSSLRECYFEKNRTRGQGFEP